LYSRETCTTWRIVLGRPAFPWAVVFFLGLGMGLPP
jgi:hypothetical protein